MEKEIKKIVNKIVSEEFSGRISNFKKQLFENEGETCECGGMMYEGECMECGNMYEGDIQELGGMEDGHPKFGRMKFKSPMSIDDIEKLLRGDDEEDHDYMKHDRHKHDRHNEYESDFVELDLGEDECVECGPMYESKKLSKGQKHIAKQAKPYDEIDANDFKKLRAKKSETKESAKPDFLDLDDDGDKEESMKSAAKSSKKVTKESKVYFTESEMIDIIENIVNEEKKKDKAPSAQNVLKSSLGRSKKENDDYIKSVTKKMKEYLKDASKGEYEMNPKDFPRGNGEIEEMEKMAYIPSDAVETYTKNLTAAALENIDYDGIHADEEWATDNIEGSSRTGNNPDWANAVETGVNKERNKIRKDNMLAKIKRQAYNKAPQPIVNDRSGNKTDSVDKLMVKLESVEDKKVISEMEKMKNLIGYNQKTQ
jgi:hypothetical protein